MLWCAACSSAASTSTRRDGRAQRSCSTASRTGSATPATAVHTDGAAVPVSFGETLPKMTNKQAEKNANAILTMVKDEVEKDDEVVE